MKPMFRLVSAVLLLAGCVSQQSQQALSTLQAQCAGGNKDACTAAGFQSQANQREQNTNTTIAAGMGAALLGAAVVGAELSGNDKRPYAPDFHHDRDHADHDLQFIH
jgi:hypothetical protein